MLPSTADRWAMILWSLQRCHDLHSHPAAHLIGMPPHPLRHPHFYPIPPQHPSQYEPELFPGLIYRMVDPKIVLLIFVSGKVVLTGAKRREEIYQAFENIYPVLKEFKKGGLLESVPAPPALPPPQSAPADEAQLGAPAPQL